MTCHSKIINILLSGETGSGKTTLINMLCNFFLGGSIENLKVCIPTKFHKANVGHYSSDELNVGDNTSSKTNSCIIYSFEYAGYTFRFIDSPGLSDTRGTDQDDKNLSIIMEAAEKAEGLNAIIIVINGANSRMTVNLLNTLQRMKGSIPDVLLNNLCVVFSNCYPSTRNFDISSFENNFQKPKKYFHFQNSVFSSDPETWNDEILEDLSDDWKKSMKSIKALLEDCKEKKQISTKAFEVMRMKRNSITAELSTLIRDIENTQQVENNLEIAKKTKSKIESDKMQYSNFVKTEEIEVTERVETATHNTLCVNHASKMVCHQGCGLEYTPSCNSSVLSGCACMGSSGKCSVCNCGPETHYHDKKFFRTVKKSVEKVLHEIKAQYDRCQQEVNTTTNQINNLGNDLTMVRQALDNKQNRIEELCRELKTICSGFNFVNELNAVIETLKLNAKTLTSVKVREDAEKRINCIEELVDRLSCK
ncbi:hypothetical protein ABK040_007067 [Willaertia magna]